jgi:hypothetical protein
MEVESRNKSGSDSSGSTTFLPVLLYYTRCQDDLFWHHAENRY